MAQEIEKIWPEWKVERRIGGGAYGTVYQAVRTDHNLTSRAAIKVISIPKDPDEIQSLQLDGMTANGTRTYLQGIVDDFVNEIQLMESLKGVQNIVSVEDYKVVERKGEIGWDIYIRMELLKPFNEWKGTRMLSENEIIRLGIDLCSALEICEKQSIIHRDIKPENIFVNDFGFFKLGDFGIARKLAATQSSQSIKGTYNYMAPEVASGSNYDSRVDIYSLGIVLYRLLNNNRLPFLETEQQATNAEARTDALNRRLQGEPLPPPSNASRDLANLVLCACAYDPNARFRSAAVMKRALLNLLPANNVAPGDMTLPGAPAPTPTPAPAPAPYPEQPGAKKKTEKKQVKEKKPKKEKPPKKKGGKKLLLLFVLLLLVGGAVVAVSLTMKGESDNLPLVGGVISKVNEENTRKKEIESILTEAATYADAGDYANAVKSITDGLTRYPEEESLTAKKTEYENKQVAQSKQDALEQAAAYAAVGNYKSALETIQLAQKQLGNDADLLQKVAEYTDGYKKATINAAAQYEQSRDYLNAYKTIADALKLVDSDASLNVKLSLYEQNYADAVVAEADSKAAALDFDGARSLLNAALKEIPNNETLKTKLSQISSAQPVSLASLTPINGGFDWGNGEPKDPFGNDYSASGTYTIVNCGNTVEYRVYGNYSKITMTIAPEQGISSGDSACIQLYADDVLVKTSPTITRKTDAVQFSVPIEGAEYISIVHSGDYWGSLILSNIQLWP